MARPQRCRKICSEPEFTAFFSDNSTAKEPITLTLDEFEVIRLVDLEHQTHEQCAKQMEIARSTVTEIYAVAREKIADSLVNGRPLQIGGGNYRLCEGGSDWCPKKQCKRQLTGAKPQIIAKGEESMRIAVPYENGQIFQHFGHTAQFKFYDVTEQNTVAAAQIVETNGSGHGALAGFLTANGVDILLCGGIGGGARIALGGVGIALFAGVTGSADDAVQAFLSKTLEFNPDARCDHHDHHHGEGHTCGDHGCGSQNCGNH